MGDRVILRNYLDLEEAVVVRSRLRAEGFDAVLENEHFLSVNPMLRFALGNRVLAPASQLADADAFLRELERHSPTVVGEACPNCTGVMRRERSLPWAAVGFLYGVPYVRDSGSAVCRQCGVRTATATRLIPAFIVTILLGMTMFFIGIGGAGYIFRY